MNLLITAALERELTPLRRSSAAGIDPNRLQLAFLKCGRGLIRARKNISEYLTTHKTDLVLNAGTAGALSPDLQKGDLIWVEELLTDSGESLKIEQRKYCSGIPEYWKRGILYSSSVPVLTDTRKQQIHRKYRAAAVDMEAYALAQECQKRELPFLAMKVISDQADSVAIADFNRYLWVALGILKREFLILLELLKINV